MKVTKGFFAKMVVFTGVFVGKVTLTTGDEVKEFVSVEGRIDEEGVEVESQDERDGALVTSHSFLYSFFLLWSCLVVFSSRTLLSIPRRLSFRLVPMSCHWLGIPST